ncbi:MAG TPA: TonB-dependent receptor plug domain-containing protein [Opitutaceae bacterium]|nr:TonB-dependent receptor plug domain-containing protein [Opitutaceae bacterium]
MNYSSYRFNICSLSVSVLSLALVVQIAAQTSSSSSESLLQKRTDDTVVLTPFEVHTDKDVGYTANSSLAGGRTDTPLKYTPSALSEVTRQFIDDLALTDLRNVAEWLPNSIPGYFNNENSAGQGNFTQRGSSGSFGNPTLTTRNYFLWYVNGDSYNVERYEFARGPNGVLFGDGPLAGVGTTFTKVARLDRPIYSIAGTIDSWGGRRGTIDINQPLTSYLAVRFNAVEQHGNGWMDRSDFLREGKDLTATLRLSPKDTIRVEGEIGKENHRLYTYRYGERASYWDGMTVNNGTTAPITTGTGLTKISGSAYNVFIPGTPSAGYANWQNQYTTTGTGASMRVYDEASIVSNAPVLPTHKFDLQPSDSRGGTNYYDYSFFYDHRFTDDLTAEVAYNLERNDTTSGNSESLFNSYFIDVNQFLPNGLPNPKFGVPYADQSLSKEKGGNIIHDLRAMVSWKVDTSWFKERITGITGERWGNFDYLGTSVYQTSGPGTTVQYNSAANTYHMRVYYDQPGAYPIGFLPNIPGYTFAWLPSYISHDRSDLKYSQVSSVTQFFNDRLTVHAGIRTDDLKDHQQSPVANAPGTNYIILGAPVLTPGSRAPMNTIGAWTNTHVSPTSKNIGAVGYILPWLGLYANYSDTFQPPSTGSNLIDNSTPPVSRSTGRDYGIKFNLPNGKFEATINYYTTRQANVINYNNTDAAQINQIWNDLNRPDLANLNYRDTSDTISKGWEIELTGNPTRDLRFTANLAFPQDKVGTIEPGLSKYYAQNITAWQAGANDPTNPKAGEILSDILVIQSQLEGATPGVTLTGTYQYTGNFYATYSFDHGSLSEILKGLSVGTGANFRGRNKVGNKLNSAYDYLYSPSYYTVSAHATYTRRIAGHSVTFQVNASNLLNYNNLITLGSVDYFPGGVSTNPRTRVLGSYRLQDPRKLLFTATLDF